MRPLRTNSQALQKLRRRPLHRAGLEHPIVFARGLHHGASLVNGEGQRLLAIDILARFAGRDGDIGVPVIGRGDARRHQCPCARATRENPYSPCSLCIRLSPLVRRTLRRSSWLTRAASCPRRRRPPPAYGRRQELVQQPAPLRARADTADSDAIIGTFPGGSAAGGVKEERRRQCGDRGCCEELATVQLVLHGAAQCLLTSTPGQPNSSNAPTLKWADDLGNTPWWR